MKKVAVILALALASMAATCPPKPPNPQPTPTPTPTPTPIPGDPLHAVGNQFVPAILGSVTTHYDWPLVQTPALDAIAAAGLNYTAMRLPLMADDRGPAYELYERVPGTTSAFVWHSGEGEPQHAYELAALLRTGPAIQTLKRRGLKIAETAPKFDLTRFSGAFDSNITGLLGYAAARGVYVNVGLWDGWGMVHTELPLFWRAGNNTQGIDIGYCSDFQQAPHPTILALVDHVVAVVGKFPNVIWELGNEANRCRPQASFIDGMRQQVRATETRLGYARHLWSPGTLNDDLSGERGSEYDYLSAHGNPKAAQAVPVEVNEFSPQMKTEYLPKLAQGRAAGTVYHYWHDDNPYGGAWDDPVWEQEWKDVLAAMKSVPPATGCTDIPNEDSVAESPRPPADQNIADAINAAMVRVTGCSVGSDCPIPEGMQSFFARVTEEIRKGDPAHPPLCAGVQTDSEGPVDQICVGTTARCQGNHVYTCNPGCATGRVGWAPGSYTNRNGDTWVRPGNACLPCPLLGQIEVKNAGQLRVVVDATPKQCDSDWGRRCSTGAGCTPGGSEENPEQRQACEAQWGPWTWTVDGAPCPTCFLDGGNPLRLVAPGQEGKTIRVTGANGIFGEVVGAHP